MSVGGGLTPAGLPRYASSPNTTNNSTTSNSCSSSSTSWAQKTTTHMKDSIMHHFSLSKFRKKETMEQQPVCGCRKHVCVLRDIKDKTVLKIYETDLPSGGHYGSLSPSRSPKALSSTAVPRPTSASAIYYTSDSDLVRTGQPSRSPGHQAIYGTRIYDVATKTQSLPIQQNYVYQHQLQQQNYATYANPEILQHAISCGTGVPSCGGSVSQGHVTGPTDQNPMSPSHRPFKPNQHTVVLAGGNHSNQNSPQRMQAIQEAVIPNQRHSVAYMPETSGSNYLPDPHQHLSDSHLPQSRSYHDYQETPISRSRMAKMEAQLANLTAWVQTTVVKDRSTPTNGSVTSDASASLQSSMSDLSSAATPQPGLSGEMSAHLKALSGQTADLRTELRNLRRLHITNTETMKDTMHKTCQCLKEVLTGVPSIKDIPLRLERAKVNELLHTYSTDADEVYRNLRDLEISVEEIRQDVLNKRCRVSMTDVESMALALSNVGRSLADLKTKFPHVQEKTNPVLAGEMEIVVKDEKLASVQDQKAPVIPSLPFGDPPGTVERKQVLCNIQSIKPDHQARIQSLEAADASRERKKKLTTNQDALRFEKELSLAQKKLKEPLQIRNTCVTTTQPSTTSTAPISTNTKTTTSTTTSNEKPIKSGQKGQAPLPPVSTNNATTTSTTLTSFDSNSNQPITSTVTITTTQQSKTTDSITHDVTNVNNIVSGVPSLPTSTCSKDVISSQVKVVNSTITSGQTASNPPVSSIQPVSTVTVQSVQPVSNSTVSSSQQVSNSTVSLSQPSSTVSMSTIRMNHSPSPTSILSTSPSPRVTATSRVVFSGVPSLSTSPNPATSTPVTKQQNHVTFSTHVTEIAEDGIKEQSKKIPPPPPPRRSSRPGGFSSPQTGRRSTSPPAYENISNFVKNDNGNLRESRSMMNGNGLHQRSRSEPAKKETGARVQLPPVSADVAALYAVPSTCRAAHQKQANLDRQANNPQSNLTLEEITTNGRLSDSDSTTSSIESQFVTPLGDHVANGKVKMREGKKVPPPPPIRRTSTLSTQSSNQSQNSNSGDENEKRKSVAELQQHFILEAERDSESPIMVNGAKVTLAGNGNNNSDSNAVQTIVTKIQNSTKPVNAANGNIPQQKNQPNKNYAETEIF